LGNDGRLASKRWWRWWRIQSYKVVSYQRHGEWPVGNIEEVMEEIRIYFNDLNKDAQIELLDFYGVESPDVMNWDTVPLIVLEKAD